MKTKWIEIIIIVMALGLISLCFAAWDAGKPADSDPVFGWPASIRDNWDALEVALGVDLVDFSGTIDFNDIDADNLMTKFTPVVNVKHSDYGALGDGSTDDTTAFQDALTAAKAIGGRVYAPASASAYIISGTLVIPAGVTFEGDGSKSYDNSKGTILDFSASTLTNAITLGETDETNYGIRLKGFKVKVGSNITNGIATNNTQAVVKSSLEDIVVFGGAAVGINLQNCWNITMREVISQNNVLGFSITNSGLATSSTIIDCIAYNSKTYGWYIDSTITYTTFISCGVDGVKDVGGDTGTGWYLAGTTRQVTFIGCGTEGCWKYYWHFNTGGNFHATLINPNIGTGTSDSSRHDENVDVIYIENVEIYSLIIIQGLRIGTAGIPGGTGLIFKNDKLARNVVFRDCRIFGSAGITATNATLDNSTIGGDIYTTLATDEIVTTGSPALTFAGTTKLDSSGGAITGTLGNGGVIGGMKTIIMTDASTSSTITVVNHITSDPEVFTFAQVGDSLVLMWNGTDWMTIHNNDVGV